MKRLLPLISVSAFAVMLIVNPEYFIASASRGLALFSTAVLPALFPFFFCSTLLTKLGAAEALSKLFEKPVSFLFNAPPEGAYVMFMSFMCGYPVGASIISDLYSASRLSTVQCKKLISFCSTSGPVFILGTVGSVIFGNINIGIIILISHYASAILNGIVFRGHKMSGYKLKQSHMTAAPKFRQHNIEAELHKAMPKICKKTTNNCSTRCDSEIINKEAEHISNSLLSNSNDKVKLNMFSNKATVQSVDNVLSDAVAKSTLTMLTLGGYIVLGNMLVDCISLLLPQLPDWLSVIVYGGIEMTRGSMLAKELTIPFSIATASAVLSFGGLSVLFQSMSFLHECRVTATQLILRKICQCVISFLLAFILSIIFIKFLK